MFSRQRDNSGWIAPKGSKSGFTSDFTRLARVCLSTIPAVDKETGHKLLRHAKRNISHLEFAAMFDNLSEPGIGRILRLESGCPG